MESGDYVLAGKTSEWDEASACLFLQLQDAAAQGLRIQEDAAQTAYSIEIENSAGVTRFGLLAAAITGDMIDITSVVTTGRVIDLVAASLTTGSAIKITLAALTTGSAIDTTGIAAAKQNFNMNASAGSTAAPQTNAPTGFFKIGIGGTDQWVPYYNAT